MNASVLYLIVCAAPPAQKIHEFVVPAKYMGWDVCVIATPQATRFLDIGVPTFFPGVFPAKQKREEVAWKVIDEKMGACRPL